MEDKAKEFAARTRFRQQVMELNKTRSICRLKMFNILEVGHRQSQLIRLITRQQRIPLHYSTLWLLKDQQDRRDLQQLQREEPPLGVQSQLNQYSAFLQKQPPNDLFLPQQLNPQS